MLHHHIGVQKYKQTHVSSSQKQWCSVWLLDVEKEAAAIKVYKRSRWTSAVHRVDLTDGILHNDHICGTHFVSGQAAKS